jgi:hypothetical protein
MAKSKSIAYLFGVGRGLLEHGAEPVKKVTEAAGAGAAVATAFTGIMPFAILGAPLLEAGIKHLEDRHEPEALLDLYRGSLLKALDACVGSIAGRADLTAADRDMLKLWHEGLSVPAKNDPWWHAMLDEDIPPATTRLLSVEPGNESSYWPLLRAQLERWTDWFRYRKTSASVPLALNVPHRPLELSPYLEEYLAANLPSALRDRFSEITAAGQRDAFNQALLQILTELNRELAPLDPLESIRDFRKKPETARTELQLLDPAYRAVPYVGRRADLDFLWQWLNSSASISIQVVAGRGGSGKTRLAYQFLEEIERRQPGVWHAGILPHDLFPNVLNHERFRRWPGRKPTLIVIDYAASCAPQLREFAIPQMARRLPGEEGDVPLRILLLERTADRREGWYAGLLRQAGSDAEMLFPNPALELGPLTPGERRELLAAMLKASGAAGRLLSAAGQDRRSWRPGRPPQAEGLPHRKPRLAAPQLGDPLVLFMAAVAARDRGDLTPLAWNRTGLARHVASRERKRLENLWAPKDPRALLHMAAYLTLSGGLAEDQLKAACQTESARLESNLYWADLKASGAGAEPIIPDIVGEAFLLHIFQEPGQDGPAAVLRAAAVKPGAVTRTLVRTIQDFASAGRGPLTPTRDGVRSGPGAVPAEKGVRENAAQESDDERDQKWALDQLTRLLKANAEALNDDAFWEIHAALPLNTVAMVRAARDFYKAVVDRRDPAQSLVGLAALEAYAVYEGKAGNRPMALAAATKAVTFRRELAAANPEAFLPDLAMSLNNQATFQSEMGQRPQALASIEEAVKIRRELAAANPEAFLPDLATSLNNQANRQSGMGQRPQALASIEEAVKHYRELAATNPQAFLPDLAMSVNNRANLQSEMGQRPQALASIEEAVKHYRELAAANPEAFLPDLARSLNNQVAFQSETGQRPQALASIEEAVKIRRELAAANPKAFLPDLAASLNNQANRQSEMGQRPQALASIQEAVRIRRELAAANPEAFLPDLAMSLNNQANRQSEMGQRPQALASIEEAVKYYRELAAANPEAFLPNLARSHYAWGAVLLAAEAPGDGAAKFAEGIRLITPLARNLPEAHLSLALALAREYARACELAGIAPDPDLTWPVS